MGGVSGSAAGEVKNGSPSLTGGDPVIVGGWDGAFFRTFRTLPDGSMAIGTLAGGGVAILGLEETGTNIPLAATEAGDLRTILQSTSSPRIADSSVNNNVGVLVGLIPPVQVLAPWEGIGYAYKFNGIDYGSGAASAFGNSLNQGINCGPAAAAIKGVGAAAVFTAEILFNTFTNVGIFVLFDFGNVLVFLNGGTLNVAITDNLNVTTTMTTGVVPVGKHAMAVAYDGVNMRLYLDAGAPNQTVAISGMSASFAATNTMIGKSNNATRDGDPANAILAEFRVSNVDRYPGHVYATPTAPFIPDANTLVLEHFNYTHGFVYASSRDDYDDQESVADQAGAGGVLTFAATDARSCAAVVTAFSATTMTAPVNIVARASAGANDAPTAAKGWPCFDGMPAHIPVRCGFVKVFAPAGVTVSVVFLKRVS